MARRALFSVLLALLLGAPALAQSRNTFEAISVSVTAVPVTRATYAGLDSCVAVVEGAAVRMREDGTAPTTLVGTIIPDGGAWLWESIENLPSVRFIRDDGTDAVVNVTCWPPSAPSRPIGAGGGGASSVTIAGGTVTSDAGSGWATDCTHAGSACTTGPQGMLGATSTYQAAVTTGQAARAAAGLDGIQIVRPNAHVGDFVKNVVAITDGSSTSIVAAQGSGIRFCATTIVVSNSSATNVTVDIRDGTAGAVIMTVPAPANMGGPGGIPLGVPLCTTANTAMAADPSAAATTVAVTAIGYRTAQ